MTSPFYTPGPDIYGGFQAARQDAQRDFANRLSQLYAGGDQQAGQQLAGIAPYRVTAVRQALENMPGTAQNQLKERVNILKKWHMAIDAEPDPANKAIMYNQMLANVKAHGGDVSSLSPSYDPQSFQSQLMDTLSVEELLNQRRESRLQESVDKMGQAGQDRAFLASGDASTPEWQTLFARTFRPTISMSGLTQVQLIPDQILDKAVAAGMNIPADWVTDQQAARMRNPSAPQKPAPLPGEISPQAAQAAGLGGIAGASVKQVPGMKTPEQLQIEKEQRDEARRIAAEQRDRENQQRPEQTKAKEFLPQLQTGMDMLDAYERSLRQKGAAIMDPELNARFTAFQMQLKNLYQLGALAGPDLQLLESSVTPPTSAKGQFYGKEGLLKQLEVAREQYKQSMKRWQSVAEGAQGGTTKPAVAPEKKSRAGF